MDLNRKKPNPQNQVHPDIEEKVIRIATYEPAWKQQRVSNEFKRPGILISPGGVRSVWLRHDLVTFKKRLTALEAKVAQEGCILTEAQLQVLEKAKVEKKSGMRLKPSIPVILAVRILSMLVI